MGRRAGAHRKQYDKLSLPEPSKYVKCDNISFPKPSRHVKYDRLSLSDFFQIRKTRQIEPPQTFQTRKIRQNEPPRACQHSAASECLNEPEPEDEAIEKIARDIALGYLAGFDTSDEESSQNEA